MITKPTLVCDGCGQSITEERPATIEFIPIRGGLFFNLPANKVEHRITDPVHLHGTECFVQFTDKLVAAAKK